MAATDGSESANRAIDVAAELAKAVGGRLYILNVAGNLSGETLDEVMRSTSLEKNIGDIIDAFAGNSDSRCGTRAARGSAGCTYAIGLGQRRRKDLGICSECTRGCHRGRKTRSRASCWPAARQRVAEGREPCPTRRDRSSMTYSGPCLVLRHNAINLK